MGWTSGVREDTPKGKRTRFYCRVKKNKHYLGVDRAEAHRKFGQILRDAGVVRSKNSRPPDTVFDLVDRWEHEHPGDWRNVELRFWLRYAAKKPLGTLTDDHFEKFARWMKRQTYTIALPSLKGKPQKPKTYSARSIRGAVRIASQAAAWAAKKEWIKSAPDQPRRLPKPTRNPRDVSPDALAAALESLGHAESIIRFIVAVGCRPREARDLLWSWVDLKKGMVIIPREGNKTGDDTGRGKTIYLTPTGQAILKKLTVDVDVRVNKNIGTGQKSKQRSGYVFPSSKGRPYTSAGLRSILRRRGITPYRLRHTFAQQALENDVRMEVVAKLLGHSNLTTVQLYSQVRDRQALAAAKSLG